MGVIEILKERGFIENMTHEDELFEYLKDEGASGYIGFDPTASSLHVGSLVPIMALAHMQKTGHRPIALVGGGTGLIGDPSGKTEMRQFITHEDVENNKTGIKNQLSRFIDFNDGKACLIDNAEWLTSLKYIDFLRDIGRYFSVNRMIKAESYKLRLDSEEGLSFIEFNYMLLQAYDFMKLAETHNCLLQMGGSDQWGNIVAGIDLIRRKQQKSAFGITFPLITTSSGAKMGKTASGAVWLDADRTSPYDYYQFWVNADDADVEKFLSLFTFLPLNEIKYVGNLDGSELNNAKAVLAFETTCLAHGNEEALKAFHAAASMFGKKTISEDLLPSSSIPRGQSETKDESVPYLDLDLDSLKEGIPVFKLFSMTGLTKSGSAARKLIEQGGAYVNNDRISSGDLMINARNLDENGEILLRAGKKRYYKIRVQ
ncbi:MAG: tyrosine--tRNA ligase [Proteobacteria bacterium]|nr:tyrosine--tRNA ligase [Pseudomonadota bacterium]